MRTDCNTCVIIEGQDVDLTNVFKGETSGMAILRKMGYRDYFLEYLQEKYPDQEMDPTISSAEFTRDGKFVINCDGMDQANNFIKLVLIATDKWEGNTIKSSSYDGNSDMHGNDMELMMDVYENPSAADYNNLLDLAEKNIWKDMYNPQAAENKELIRAAKDNLDYVRNYDPNKFTFDWSCFSINGFKATKEAAREMKNTGEGIYHLDDVYLNGVKLSLHITSAKYYPYEMTAYMDIGEPVLENFSNKIGLASYESVKREYYDIEGIYNFDSGNLQHFLTEKFPLEEMLNNSLTYEAFKEKLEFIVEDFFINEDYWQPIDEKLHKLIHSGSDDFMDRYEYELNHGVEDGMKLEDNQQCPNNMHDKICINCVAESLKDGLGFGKCIDLVNNCSPVADVRDEDYAFKMVVKARDKIKNELPREQEKSKAR